MCLQRGLVFKSNLLMETTAIIETVAVQTLIVSPCCVVGKNTFEHFSLLGVVTTLLENPKGPVRLGNPSAYSEAKLGLFLFMPASKIVSPKTEVLKQLFLNKYK